MRKTALAVVALFALATFAGTSSKDSTGAKPTAATDGVSILDRSACLFSIRVDGGGNIAPGCKLVPWYRNDAPLTEWVEAPLAQVCTTTATFDGGMRDTYLCPQVELFAKVGRYALQKVNCIGADGGSGAAALADAGPSVQPVVNVTCWGPGL